LSSFATTTDLASKVDKVVKVCHQKIIPLQKAKLGSISGTNTGDQDLSSFATTTELASKVDKVVGKVCHQKIIHGRESEIRCNLRYQYRRSGFE
jgi:hypothetical protein